MLVIPAKAGIHCCAAIIHLPCGAMDPRLRGDDGGLRLQLNKRYFVMYIFLITLIAALLVIFGYRRLLFITKFMQQQNNYNYRLWRFAYLQRNIIDKRVAIPSLIAAVGFVLMPNTVWAAIPAAALGIAVIREKNPLKGGIKPLVMTPRIKRMFWTAFILWTLTVLFFTVSLFKMLIIVPIMALAAPLFIMAANKIMAPVEWLNGRKYIIEGRRNLEKYNPTVIAITGSFAKTSMKNILHHILSSASTSLTTKRSINTLMGLVRVAREELNSDYKFFVAEVGMGAPGQIIEIAKFLNPKHGMIMSVGTKYFENFKRGQDGIAKELFVLSKYIARRGGRTMINAESVAPEFIKKYAAPNDIIIDGDIATDIKQKRDGIYFTVNYGGEKTKLFAPVFGTHQAKNIAMAFIMARDLGVPKDSIVQALKSLPQTEHRLEVKEEGGLTILDDSYNSNMSGFISAMELGESFRKKGQKFIVVTPGMVSLGDLHAEQHSAVGKVANKLADKVIAIGADRIRDFTNEILPEKLVEAASQTEARAWIASNTKPGDIVLYENDLPDLYVEKISV